MERYGLVGMLVVLGTLETLFHLPIFFNNGRSATGGQNGTRAQQSGHTTRLADLPAASRPRRSSLGTLRTRYTGRGRARGPAAEPADRQTLAASHT
jgi:hypothetical protein